MVDWDGNPLPECTECTWKAWMKLPPTDWSTHIPPTSSPPTPTLTLSGAKVGICSFKKKEGGRGRPGLMQECGLCSKPWKDHQ
jgi:hypothetical protein